MSTNTSKQHNVAADPVWYETLPPELQQQVVNNALRQIAGSEYIEVLAHFGGALNIDLTAIFTADEMRELLVGGLQKKRDMITIPSPQSLADIDTSCATLADEPRATLRLA